MGIYIILVSLGVLTISSITVGNSFDSYYFWVFLLYFAVVVGLSIPIYKDSEEKNLKIKFAIATGILMWPITYVLFSLLVTTNFLTEVSGEKSSCTRKT